MKVRVYMPRAAGRTEAQSQIEVENERVGIREQRSSKVKLRR